VERLVPISITSEVAGSNPGWTCSSLHVIARLKIELCIEILGYFDWNELALILLLFDLQIAMPNHFYLKQILRRVTPFSWWTVIFYQHNVFNGSSIENGNSQNQLINYIYIKPCYRERTLFDSIHVDFFRWLPVVSSYVTLQKSANILVTNNVQVDAWSRLFKNKFSIPLGFSVKNQPIACGLIQPSRLLAICWLVCGLIHPLATVIQHSTFLSEMYMYKAEHSMASGLYTRKM
jgi:hypothetical protein